ncbi:MAG: hypothetical protein ACYDCL_02175 [Myxococcales bacterium]
MLSVLLAVALSASPRVSSAAMQKARAFAVRSIREYNLGKFDEALKDAEEAYELSGLPALLFNLGQCHRAMRHWEKAAFFYRGFLRDNPRASNRAEVVRLLAAMEAKAAAQPSAPSSAPAPAPAPAPILVEAQPPRTVVAESPATPAVPEAAVSAPAARRHRIRPAAWWLGGAGLVGGIGGTALYAVASSSLSSDHRTPLGNGAYQHSISASAYGTAATEGEVGEALWAVGGALLVSGVIAALIGGAQ